MYHQPVLLHECIQALNISPDGIYVDATFGGGGHARAILQQLSNKGKLVAFDQDPDAQQNIPDDPRLLFVPHNFAFIKRFLKLHGINSINGILADLGVSSFQFDMPQRGFSYRFDAPLDMRMNQQNTTTAAHIINTYPEEQLLHLFSTLGEVRNARTLAQTIADARKARPLHTINDLLTTIQPIIRGDRPKYLAQVFQALRIQVNDELNALQNLLTDTLPILAPNARIAIISFHSLEDRIVKNFFRYGYNGTEPLKDDFGNIHRPLTIITKSPIEATPTEIKTNPRAHSAKLRVAQKNP
jgi:16S rRNA (cytosine1402-N4)-methyltransferase